MYIYQMATYNLLILLLVGSSEHCLSFWLRGKTKVLKIKNNNKPIISWAGGGHRNMDDYNVNFNKIRSSEVGFNINCFIKCKSRFQTTNQWLTHNYIWVTILIFTNNCPVDFKFQFRGETIYEYMKSDLQPNNY